MSIRIKQWLIVVVLTVGALGISVARGGDSTGGAAGDPVRTIVLTAKDMKFNATNPTINLEPGEWIRLVIRNEDPGMKHDLTIPELGLRSAVIETGETTVLSFRVPKNAFLTYLCSFHPVSMKGVFSVDDGSAAGELAQE